MPKLKLRVEITANGAIITNRETNSKSVDRNTTPAIKLASDFMLNAISEGEPGQYFDLDVNVQPQRIKSVTA